MALELSVTFARSISFTRTDLNHSPLSEKPMLQVGKTDVTSHLLTKVAQRKGRGGFRIDKISDGDRACGFAWTWTCGNEEGLRGTTFVELNDRGEINLYRRSPSPFSNLVI